MAKKQIKELVIKVTSPGGKEANTELKQLAQSLETALDASNGLTVSLKTGSKFLAQMAVSYSSVTKSINDSVIALKALNTALNGGTAKASKNINAYVDNLQILTMYLMDAADVAKQFQLAMSTGSGTGVFTDKIDRIIDILEALETTTFDTADALRRMDVTMGQVATNTGKAAARIKQTRDSVTDLDVTTNRGNETLEEYASRLRDTGQRFEQTGKKAATFNNQLKNLNGTGSQSARSFSSLAFGMNPLVSTYAAIAVNVYALTEAFRLLKDAAALDRLEEQTSRFAASMTGINVKGLARDLQELSGGALDAAESLKQAVRGISFGFSPELLRELTEGARKASVALGRDFTDSMDRVVRGISKGEVELLDELGVVTRLETAFKNYASTMGLEADKLTDSQRTLALAQEVNIQLAQKYAAFETAANSLERLGVASTDASNRMLKAAAAGVSPLAEALTGLIDLTKPIETNLTKANQSLAIYNEAIASGNVLQATTAYYEYVKAMEAVNQETINGIDVNSEAAKQMKKNSEVVGSLNRVLAAGVIALTAFKGAAAISAVMSAATIAISGTSAALAVLNGLLFGSAVAGKASSKSLKAVAGSVVLLALSVAALATMGIALRKSFSNGTEFTEEFSAATSKAKDTIVSLLNSTAELSGISSLTEMFTGATEGAEELSAAMLQLRDVSKGVGVISGISPKEAEKALLFLKDTAAGYKAVGESVGNLKRQDTELEKISQSLTQMGTIDSTLFESAKALDEWATSINRLADIGVVSVRVGIKVDDKGKVLNRAEIEAQAKKVVETGKQLATIDSDRLANLRAYEYAQVKFQGKADEQRLLMAKQLQTSTEELADVNVMLASGSTDILEQDSLRLRQSVLILETQIEMYDWAKSLEQSIYDSNIAYERQASILSLAGASQVELLQIEKERMSVEKARLASAGASTVDVSRQMEALDIQISAAKVAEGRSRLEQQMEHSYAIQSLRLEEKNALESDFISLQIKEIAAKQNMEGLTQLEVEKYGMQVELLEEKLRITKQQEAVQRNIYNLETQLIAQERATDAALNNVGRVEGLKAELALKQKIYEQDKLNMTAEQRARTEADLAFEKKSLSGQSKAAPFADASETLGYMSQFEGLTELQSTFASSMSDLSSTYSDFLAQSETGSSNFMDFLSGNTEALANTMSAGLSLAQSAFAEISASKVASIDLEIAAEQRRDGKSAESLAKLKKLQAQKIKEEAKAKKASIGMSTAAAVMQALGDLPFPANLVLAGAVGAMGLLQMSNVDKAANGQLAALNGASSGNLSISAGSRSNNVDVSRNANAGELAYLSGSKGTGTANNFTPGRAGFGASSAGTSIVVGESGPEIVTPTVPVTVSPASQSTGSQITFSPIYQLSSVDTEGMQALLDKHSRQLYASLETELNARNMTLNSLK